MSTSTLTPPTEHVAKTKFTYTRCPGVPTASALAAPLGLLDAEFGEEPDLDVTLKSIGFKPRLEYSHEDRFWIRNAGHAPAVWGRANGVDSRVVALAWLEGSYPVVSLAASEIRSVADLKGKRLGLVVNKELPFDLQQAQQLKIHTTTLGTVGLTLDDVKLVIVEREHQQASAPSTPESKKQAALLFSRSLAARLAEGEFDAVTARFPAEVADSVGLRVLYDTRNHPDPLARVNPSVLRGVVVSAPLLRERRDLVVRALARLLQATEWAKANPGQVAEKLASDYKVYPEALTSAYQDLAEGIQLDLSPQRIAGLKAQTQFLLQHQFIKKDFDVDAWVDRGPLAEARALLAEWKRAGRVG